jgi:FdhD protein
LKDIENVPCIYYPSSEIGSDFVVSEKAIQIIVNNKPLFAVMATPSKLQELVTGIFYSEGIYDKKFDFIYSEKNGIIEFLVFEKKIKSKKNRSQLSVSSCGICGTNEFDKEISEKLEIIKKLEIAKLSDMFLKLSQLQKIFEKTGGLHSAAVFDSEYSLLSANEDIGRHNAVDKCIGDLILTEKLENSFALLVSGRVSFEIIWKAYRAKIPYIIAISAVSSEAIRIAEKAGIGLIGFARNGKATIYTHLNEKNKVWDS